MTQGLELSKIESIILIIEGFAIVVICHWIGGTYLARKLLEMYPILPWLTAAMISSSAISPVVAMTYMSLRLNYRPMFIIKGNTPVTLCAGIILAWSVVFLQTLFLGKETPEAQEILKTPRPYLYLTLFLLIGWGPFLEETLARGYFFEILRRKWNDPIALLISSILFVIPHGLWGDFGFGLLFIFLDSIVFTVVYMKGGLIASILTHMFVNLYVLYLNM